jgi:hypothetical protein
MCTAALVLPWASAVFALALVGAPVFAEETVGQDRGRPSSERDGSRQRVSPGEAPSSRRESSRLRNPDEDPPTVPNRAPEVINQVPVPLPTPAGAAPPRP